MLCLQSRQCMPSSFLSTACPEMTATNGDAFDGFNLLELHDHAVSLALQAGSYLRGQAASRSGIGTVPAAELSAAIKMSSVDIVTAADIEVMKRIQSLYTRF